MPIESSRGAIYNVAVIANHRNAAYQQEDIYSGISVDDRRTFRHRIYLFLFVIFLVSLAQFIGIVAFVCKSPIFAGYGDPDSAASAVLQVCRPCSDVSPLLQRTLWRRQENPNRGDHCCSPWNERFLTDHEVRGLLISLHHSSSRGTDTHFFLVCAY